MAEADANPAARGQAIVALSSGGSDASMSVGSTKPSYVPWFVSAVKDKYIPDAKNKVVGLFKHSDGPPRTMKQRARHLATSIKAFDIFGYSPIVQFDSFVTLVGGIATLCCIIIILIYMIVTGRRFLNAPISKSQVIVPADTAGVPTPIVGLRFNDAKGNPFDDDTYFYCSVTMNYVINSDINTKQTEPIQLDKCSYYRELDVNYQPLTNDPPIYYNVTCVKTDQTLINQTSGLGNIRGIFEASQFRYLEVDMMRCIGTTPDGRNCTNSSVIDAEVYGGEIAIMWYNDDVQDVVGVHPTLVRRREWRSYRFKFATGIVLSKDIYLEKSNVTHISAWPLGKDDLISNFRESQMVDTFTTFSNTKGRYVKFIWRADFEMILEQWSPILFFDLIASWGAFWSSLLLIIGTFAIIYNGKKWAYLVSQGRLSLADCRSTELDALENSLKQKKILNEMSRRNTSADRDGSDSEGEVELP